MVMASGALQWATPALGLVQSQFPLQAQPKPGFPAHHLLSAHEGNAPALIHLLEQCVPPTLLQQHQQHWLRAGKMLKQPKLTDPREFLLASSLDFMDLALFWPSQDIR